MYIFRRAAARAVSAPSQIRPATRVASFRSSIPSIARSFHQSQSQRKEAQDAVSESSGTTSEPVGQSEHQSQTVSEQTSESAQQSQSGVSAAQDAVSESSGSTSAPLGQSETSPQSVSEQASELAQKAQSTVAEAASTVAGKAQEIPSQAQESFGNASRRVQSTASSARNAADKFNPFGGEIPKNRTLYVGNLFFETTTPQLEAEFGKFGEITNSRVITDNRGLSKGFGYIEFADQMAADEALAALDQTVLQGRRLSVQYHKRREGGRFGDRERKPMHQEMPPSKTLFIGNMSYQMSDRDLNDLFRNIRNVLDVRVAIDRRSGQPRGFAHADFIDIESAVRAKETLENKVVYGRNLRVNFSGAFRENERRDHNDRKDDDGESF